MHSAIIEVLVRANLPELNKRMTRFNLRASIYASEWIFGLFASVVPSMHMTTFFDNFFEHRWHFFYQLVLTLLKRHEHEIQNEEDMYNLLRAIKVAGQDEIKPNENNSGRDNGRGGNDEHEIGVPVPINDSEDAFAKPNDDKVVMSDAPDWQNPDSYR